MLSDSYIHRLIDQCSEDLPSSQSATRITGRDRHVMGLHWCSATCAAIAVLVVICSLQTECVDAGCPSGFETCGKSPRKPCLTSITTDATNCGRCGVKCPKRPNSTPTCSNGRCGYRCSKNLYDCDGQSRNGCETTTSQLQTSPLNCGKCGNKCPARANAAQTCDKGRCGARCNPGWKDCNNNMASDGCETNVAGNDPANCGQCGAACREDQFPHGVFKCSAGKCGLFWCHTGNADCNGVLADGCETVVVDNPLNCYGCGHVCPTFPNAVPVCGGGFCHAVCKEGFNYCYGVEVDERGCSRIDFNSDANNCGACNVACTAGTSCQGGSCV